MGRVVVSRRGLTRGIGSLVAALCLVAVVPTGAQAASSSAFVADINAARTARGGHALTVRSDLAAAAQAQAQRMADKATLYHNPNLAGSVSHWTMLAENVGYGPDVSTIHQAFMNSAGHRTNILNARYTEVGVGVVVRDHVMWVAEVFRRPSGSTAGSGTVTSKPAASGSPKKSASPPAHAASHPPTKGPAKKKPAARRVIPAVKALAVPHGARFADRARRPQPQARPVPAPGAALAAAVPPAWPTDVPPVTGVTLGVLALVVLGGAARLRALGPTPGWLRPYQSQPASRRHASASNRPAAPSTVTGSSASQHASCRVCS